MPDTLPPAAVKTVDSLRQACDRVFCLGEGLPRIYTNLEAPHGAEGLDLSKNIIVLIITNLAILSMSAYRNSTINIPTVRVGSRQSRE
jgi:hypothetical protein